MSLSQSDDSYANKLEAVVRIFETCVCLPNQFRFIVVYGFRTRSYDFDMQSSFFLLPYLQLTNALTNYERLKRSFQSIIIVSADKRRINLGLYS